ncbi:hypothetical protein BCR43DRAFT_312515 [Syncephalastrum racemosum]|uniref:Uncharacterized protein n=1 Tax=Syncephalastrum racemosum TaxID=13706 RepID=A0A1X2HAV5_SYNRA|nr:hypothetical protein BCR43DRAFT_312515 [Syncephalastrum racemosum]
MDLLRKQNAKATTAYRSATYGVQCARSRVTLLKTNLSPSHKYPGGEHALGHNTSRSGAKVRNDKSFRTARLLLDRASRTRKALLHDPIPTKPACVVTLSFSSQISVYLLPLPQLFSGAKC